jgi:hypothetical protein
VTAKTILPYIFFEMYGRIVDRARQVLASTKQIVGEMLLCIYCLIPASMPALKFAQHLVNPGALGHQDYRKPIF